MVNEFGQLEDSDLEGSQVGDGASESELDPAQGSRDRTLRDAGLETSSDDDEEGEGDEGDERDSPPRLSGYQRSQHTGHAETGPFPMVPLGTIPGPSTSSGQVGGSLYSQVGVNLVESIKNPRKCEASRDVLDAFSGPPKKRDPDHIKLKGMGWTMPQRVLHLKMFGSQPKT